MRGRIFPIRCRRLLLRLSARDRGRIVTRLCGGVIQFGSFGNNSCFGALSTVSEFVTRGGLTYSFASLVRTGAIGPGAFVSCVRTTGTASTTCQSGTAAGTCGCCRMTAGSRTLSGCLTGLLPSGFSRTSVMGALGSGSACAFPALLRTVAGYVSRRGMGGSGVKTVFAACHLLTSSRREPLPMALSSACVGRLRSRLRASNQGVGRSKCCSLITVRLTRNRSISLVRNKSVGCITRLVSCCISRKSLLMGDIK